jgi:GNAT superfamily N-acetyltransferase
LSGEDSLGFRVRRAVAGDRRAMAHVHVESWKTTYRGIVPDLALDALTVESDLAKGFGRHLEDPPPDWRAYVGEVRGGKVVGFAIGHSARDPHPPGLTGELGAIYLLQEHQRKGLGRMLVHAVAQGLREQGHRNMVVWVVVSGPARGFYEAMGARICGEQQREVMGTPMRLIAYGWDDLSLLLGDA